MTERERLIELLEEADQVAQAKGITDYKDAIADNADHLISNGVIVPPVKLGSRHKVYIPITGTTVVYDTKVYGIGVDEDGDIVINPKEYPEEVISINGFNFGKSVFLTKEEAEKALKEKQG